MATAMMIDSAMAPPEPPVPGVPLNANACEITISTSYDPRGGMLPKTTRPGEPDQPTGKVPPSPFETLSTLHHSRSRFRRIARLGC